MAKNSEDIRLQELETCQAFKWPPSAEEAAASAGLVKGCLKALSSASGGRKADFAEWPFQLSSKVYPAEEAKTVSRSQYM